MFKPIFFLSVWKSLNLITSPELIYSFSEDRLQFYELYNFMYYNTNFSFEISSHDNFLNLLYPTKYHQLWYIKYHNLIYFKSSTFYLIDSQITRYYQYKYSTLGSLFDNVIWNPIIYNYFWWFKNIYPFWSIVTGESVNGYGLIPPYLKYGNFTEVGIFYYDGLLFYIESLMLLSEIIPQKLMTKFVPWDVLFSYERFPITYSTTLPINNSNISRLLFNSLYHYFLIMINDSKNVMFTMFNNILHKTFILNPLEAPQYCNYSGKVDLFLNDINAWWKLYAPQSVDEGIGRKDYNAIGSTWLLKNQSIWSMYFQNHKWDFYQDLINMLNVFTLNKNIYNLPLIEVFKNGKIIIQEQSDIDNFILEQEDIFVVPDFIVGEDMIDEIKKTYGIK